MNKTMQEAVFTIGHSTHPQARFIALLLQHGITALCDVRSTPYSRANPQFNREELKESLRDCGIKYVFLGKELGARSEDPACYESGKVQYDRLARTDLFRLGLKRVLKGMKGYRLALMCAEKEPLECHRTILVARHLADHGLDVQHIHADGRLESHAEALSRLIRMLNLHEQDMFQSREELLANAYRRQERRIAYDSREVVPEDARASGASG
ncbi:MAG TPA: DUF488 domain-containing protein [Candidatus Acidoferrales bacterium]|nr:DUF488 domain-containing protein [Candidatus Acidoferrales bacterium]